MDVQKLIYVLIYLRIKKACVVDVLNKLKILTSRVTRFIFNYSEKS